VLHSIKVPQKSVVAGSLAQRTAPEDTEKREPNEGDTGHRGPQQTWRFLLLHCYRSSTNEMPSNENTPRSLDSDPDERRRGNEKVALVHELANGGMPGERQALCSGISGKSLNGPIFALVNKPREWCGVYHRNQVPLEIELLESLVRRRA